MPPKRNSTRGTKQCPKCKKRSGIAKKTCDCGHSFKMKSKKKATVPVFIMHLGPQIGDKTTDDEGSVWQITSVEGSKINWKLVQESELSKKIDMMLDPIYTGWREKLLHTIPRVLHSTKIDSNWFYKPLITFLKDHNMLNESGILRLEPFTTDEPRLRLFSRLWLFYKERLRIYRMHRSRRVDRFEEHQELLKTAKKMAEINKRENENLMRRLEELEQEELQQKTTLVPKQPVGIQLDSDDDF